MTLNLKEQSPKSRAYTLIELVLWLGLFSILALSFYSVIQYTNNVSKMAMLDDEALINGRYAIEYLKKEILEADKIISIDKFPKLKEKYPYLLDFVIVTIATKRDKDGNLTVTNHNYSAYYLSDDKLVRIASNKTHSRLPDGSDFSGHNNVCLMVKDMAKTKADALNKSITIAITTGEGRRSFNFKTQIHFTCPLEL